MTIGIKHPTNKVNFTQVYINEYTLYFSYQTLVGVESAGQTRVIQNSWGPTTGKHLNHIDGGDKKSRLDSKEFDSYVDSLGLTQ